MLSPNVTALASQLSDVAVSFPETSRFQKTSASFLNLYHRSFGTYVCNIRNCHLVDLNFPTMSLQMFDGSNCISFLFCGKMTDLVHAL